MATPTFSVGDRIRLHTRPPYLKSDDNMPMLRPPDLIEVGEEGTVLSRKPGGYLGIRFERGKFLIDAQYIEPVDPSDTPDSSLEK
ncbi:MAG: DUF3148 domain-containing protein [Cyanobacteria bacterium P01_D01_bin.1]